VLLTSGLAWWLLRRMRRAEKVRMAMARELTQIVRHAQLVSRVWRRTVAS